ncbi:hypothetical protein, partial [Tessaracoccus sp. OH4464_COT-324]|uniref:hypothetical protein n=1 Tax=Tessaracoccus sp. OH4464_COT-324 TaxID=2491059 RepID=UPI00131A46F0
LLTGTFQDKFEELAPHFIATAWDFTDRDDRIEAIWVAVGYEEDGSKSAVPAYQVDGRKLLPHELGQIGVDASPDAQHEMFMALNDLAQKYAEIGDEVPRLSVLRFQTADSDLRAEFSYQPWEPGVKEDDKRLIVHLVHMWCQHLVETGDDSADWRPPQDYRLV